MRREQKRFPHAGHLIACVTPVNIIQGIANATDTPMAQLLGSTNETSATTAKIEKNPTRPNRWLRRILRSFTSIRARSLSFMSELFQIRTDFNSRVPQGDIKWG